MAKSTPTTIAQALACVKRLRNGKACSMTELKATVLLLDDARKTALGTIRLLKEETRFLTGFLNRN